MEQPISPSDEGTMEPEDGSGNRSSVEDIREDITDDVLNPRVLEEGEEEQEEAKRAKGAAVPNMPSREEVEEHRLTHAPYRSWCRHCVCGKAKSNPNHSSKGCVREVPIVVLDYMYMR